MFRSHREYLQYYFEKYGYYFKVQRNIEFPYTWYNYGTPEYYEFVKLHGHVNNREIFPDEIVFDIDIETETLKTWSSIKRECFRVAKAISRRLEVLTDTNHTIWDSGRKGYHIHCLFPILNNFNSNDRREIKREFLKELSYGLTTAVPDKAYSCMAPKMLIQLERVRNRNIEFKGETKKADIKYMVENINLHSLNNGIPETIIKRGQEKVEKYKSMEYKFDGTKPKEIALIESDDFVSMKDGQRRALFVLSAYYCFINKNDDEVFTILNEWNKYKLNKIFTSSAIKKEIYYRRKAKINAIPIRYANNLLEDIGLK